MCKKAMSHSFKLSALRTNSYIPVRRTLSVCISAILALNGCALLPSSINQASSKLKESLSLPTQWFKAGMSETSLEPPRADKTTAANLEKQWWRVYDDAQLNRLVEQAQSNNADIAIAAARFEQAMAELGVTRSEEFPSISATAASNRTRATQLGSNPLPPSFSPLTRATRLSIDTSWEIDLWGKLKSETQAAQASLMATAAAQEGVKLVVAAQTADLYFALQALNKQETTLRQVLKGREVAYALQKQRYDVGLSSELELRLAESELANVMAQLPQTEQQVSITETALRVLLGQSPRDLVSPEAMPLLAREDSQQALPAAKEFSPPAVLIPEGVPSELLLRRPDLQQSEQLLKAADANLAAARAAYYPSIRLTGFLGTESADLSDLFKGPSRVFQFAGSLTQPIFQARKLQFFEQASKARQSQALTSYQQAIRNAFKDVADALAVQQKSGQRYDAETKRSNALMEAVKVAQLRYKQGISSQLDVLDAERNLLQAQLNATDAWRAQRSASVSLIKALGGGWK